MTEPAQPLPPTRPRFKPYPAYKDSGVEWLGEIPAHWEVNRTKFAARLRSGHTPSRQHPEYWQDCTIPWFGLADVWQIRDGQIEFVYETTEKISELGLANSAARLLPTGTVILSRTASVGFSAILGVDMATTQDFVNWVCGPTLQPEYLLYVFRSMAREFGRLTMGSTHQTIYMPDVGSFSTPIPPAPEQNQIVAFVRKERTTIDALVAKKERLIALLQEQRTALITRAATKGLDPNVPMRDSGVEWLGEIPAHWVVKPLKRVFANLDSMRVPLSGEERATMTKEYPYYGASGVIDHVEDFLFDEPLILVAEDGANLYSRSTPLAFVATGRYWVNNHAHILKPLDGDVSYWAQVLSSVVLDPWISGSAQPKLTGEKLGSIPLPVLPLSERRGIAAFLDRETARIDALVAKVRDAIDRLKELRTALISAAVTGKIDVREEAG